MTKTGVLTTLRCLFAQNRGQLVKLAMFRQLWLLAWLLASSLAVAIEVLTTLRYWRQLSWRESAYLGISYFRGYLWEHLIGWVVALLLL